MDLVGGQDLSWVNLDLQTSEDCHRRLKTPRQERARS